MYYATCSFPRFRLEVFYISLVCANSLRYSLSEQIIIPIEESEKLKV